MLPRMAENPPAPSRIRALPSWLLGRAAARGRGLVAEALARHDMKMWHHVVLAAVADLGPVAQAELGRTVSLDPKDVVGILKDLQTAGLVVRAPDPADRRKNAVTLTTAGERRLEECTKAGKWANDELLAPLSAAEREQFLEMLRRISRVR
ncbi:HTH-type transcriptional repressor NicR [Streptomyces jeddahensis]|uniref:HTH-type transcriptional repressor NicR n=2 Tax=Streptomyces jeddahensis TaxID=1716141 RepID=A0A177HHU6_9ACTN|nr:HTH-type transcriptional repressor NicR [Streptomyces jeddahensis]